MKKLKKFAGPEDAGVLEVRHLVRERGDGAGGDAETQHVVQDGQPRVACDHASTLARRAPVTVVAWPRARRVPRRRPSSRRASGCGWLGGEEVLAMPTDRWRALDVGRVPVRRHARPGRRAADRPPLRVVHGAGAAADRARARRRRGARQLPARAVADHGRRADEPVALGPADDGAAAVPAAELPGGDRAGGGPAGADADRPLRLRGSDPAPRRRGAARRAARPDRGRRACSATSPRSSSPCTCCGATARRRGSARRWRAASRRGSCGAWRSSPTSASATT